MTTVIPPPPPAPPEAPKPSRRGRRQERRQERRARTVHPARFRALVQVGAFLRKELADVVRQPRLLLLLVAGPFLILLAFGLGYRSTPEPYRTEFVIPPGSPFGPTIERSLTDIRSVVDYKGSTADEATARRRLANGNLDLVVVFPADPLGTVMSGHRAPITVLHTRLDPVEETAISFASRLAVEQVNTQVLSRIVSGGQDAVRPAGAVADAVVTQAQQVRDRIAAGDAAGARSQLNQLQSDVTTLQQLIRSSEGLTAQVGGSQLTGAADQATAVLGDLSSAVNRLSTAMDQNTASPGAANDLVNQATRARDELTKLTAVQADVLVHPFDSKVENVVPGDRNITDFYAPAALVLLLQQFGLAFGALSFVRERQLGVVELFRAGPVNASEALIGKYLAYLVLGGVVGAVLVLAVVYGLGVPMQGDWIPLAVALGLVLLASVGLGFVISLTAGSDSQAVQWSMLVLLASLFFSGFFLSLRQLARPARIVSWLLPATPGMALARDVMLRGVGLSRSLVAILVAYVLVTAALATWRARRMLRCG